MLFLLLIFLLLIPTSNPSPIFLLFSSSSGEVDITQPPPGFSGVSTGTRYCAVHCSNFVGSCSFSFKHRSIVVLLLSYSHTLVHSCSCTLVHSYLIYISPGPRPPFSGGMLHPGPTCVLTSLVLPRLGPSFRLRSTWSVFSLFRVLF